MLSEEEKSRYSRHLILADFGKRAQEKLKASSVLCIGAGGLGSPVCLYLAAAGIGRLGIADFDTVELSNLQRQVIHTTAEIGVSKALSAKRKVEALNPNVAVVLHDQKVDAANILPLIGQYDFVIDATDNFAAKFLINDACVLAGKPYSHGAVLKYAGQCITVHPHHSACYACLFDSPPEAGCVPTTSTDGLLGSIPGILGSIQATEAIKYLTGVGKPLLNELLSFEALSMMFKKVHLKRNPNCRVCGQDGIKELRNYPNCA